MFLTLNGEPREVPDGTTVSQLLQLLKVTPERVVVEINLNILKRAEHAGTVLNAGDQVELVQFVGGGSVAAEEDRYQIPFLRSAREMVSDTGT